MVSLRALPVVMAAALLASVLIPFVAPPAAAQEGPEYGISEAPGDVRLHGGELANAPGLPASALTNAVDLVTARVYGETGLSILFEVYTNDMSSNLIAWLHAGICFKWNGVEYAIHQEFRTGLNGLPSGTWLHKLDEPCAVGGRLSPNTPGENREIMEQDVTMDSSQGRITISVPRMTLAELGGGEAPKAGDTIGNLFAMTWDQPLVGGPVRWDAMPDGGPDGGALELALNTSGIGGGATLEAWPVSNSGSRVCGERKDAPVYVFEAGGKRGIPLIFQNVGETPAKVLFTVETLEGSDWSPRILPQLNVRPFTEVGNVTVNVIVDPPPTTNHKDCTVLRVKAVEEGNPSNAAEVLVGAFAVVPPSAERNRLYLHMAGGVQDVCGARQTWLNTLLDDPDEASSSLALRHCQDHSPMPMRRVGFQTGLDINHDNNLAVNTTAVGKHAIFHAVLQGDDLVETRARLSVTLVTQPGRGQVGESVAFGTVDLAVPGGVSNLDIPMNIDFTRDEVPTGDPSRILYAADGLGFILAYRPLECDPLVQTACVAGTISILKGTNLELPIWATIQRNVANPGDSGRLISLGAADALPEFVRPGHSRIFNYTILNEAAEADVALLEANLTGARGWTVTFLPSNRVPLLAGESKIVQATLSAPATANESESIVFEVIVRSENDPTARSSLSAKVIATDEADVENVILDAGDEEGGFVPSAGALAFLASVASVALALRKRRR